MAFSLVLPLEERLNLKKGEGNKPFPISKEKKNIFFISFQELQKSSSTFMQQSLFFFLKWNVSYSWLFNPESAFKYTLLW